MILGGCRQAHKGKGCQLGPGKSHVMNWSVLGEFGKRVLQFVDWRGKKPNKGFVW